MKSESNTHVQVETPSLTVEIRKSDFTVRIQSGDSTLVESARPFGWKGNAFEARIRLFPDQHIYGLGEKTGFLDKRGKRYVMWNSDVFAAHTSTTDSLYVSVPFFICVGEKSCYGFYLDNSWRTVFDMGETEPDEYAVCADGGNLDFYVIAGNTPADVLSSYIGLTGSTPLPPAWSLGYHQSRFSYRSEEEVLGLAEEFSRREIPCAAIHLDIHHMEGYRTFTWDEEAFPDPEGMTSALRGHGIRAVSIVDPGIKVDSSYPVYREMADRQYWCRHADGTPFVGDVWPGRSVFPDFVREDVRRWWGEKIVEYLQRHGIEGVWHDMNEPAVFSDTSTMDTQVLHGNPAGDTHERYHNMYGLLENMASYEAIKEKTGKRPFILTRAGFAGIQRYAAVWTGDNRSMWEHLELSLPMLLNMGLSGISFIGADIGGFSFNSDPELLVRWYQLGALYPFARNHCENNARHQEPWSFGPDVERMVTESIRFRYRLMPDLYTSFHLARETGRPVIRPLLYDFPRDRTVFSIYDQFLFGDSLMAAPVLRPGSRNRAVYIPEGVWFDYHTGERHEGGSWIVADAPLERMPMFVRAGSFLMTDDDTGALTISLYPDESAKRHEWQLYCDDGESFSYQSGEYLLDTFRYEYVDGRMLLSRAGRHENYTCKYRLFRVAINGSRTFASVQVDGTRCALPFQGSKVVDLPLDFAQAAFS